MTYTVLGGTLNCTHSLTHFTTTDNRQHYEIDDSLDDNREDY